MPQLLAFDLPLFEQEPQMTIGYAEHVGSFFNAVHAAIARVIGSKVKFVRYSHRIKEGGLLPPAPVII
jgi:hypothetical protein